MNKIKNYFYYCKLHEWMDRNWNLLFHRSKCIKFAFFGRPVIPYKTVITMPNNINAVCLGKNWFKEIPDRPKKPYNWFNVSTETRLNYDEPTNT